MFTRLLRRWGVWPVIAAVTLISIGLSIAISAFVQVVMLGLSMPASAWLVTVGCPLLIAPLMSFHSFKLLLRLDRAHEDLRMVSITDHLTGVANRRHFMAQLLAAAERSLREGTPFSVALIDIDNFKAINDQHGHLGGDEVLRQLARTCAGQVREGDTFARFGGEEFAVLLPHTAIEPAMHWLERLREHVAALRVELPTGSIGVTVSIGLAAPAPLAAQPDGQINTALFLADQALYRAKREGKNRVALPMPVAA